jgi:hypothetical protein
MAVGRADRREFARQVINVNKSVFGRAARTTIS